MANASLSSASTTPTNPSSAWSRLVQITRTASEGLRTKSTASSRLADQTSSHINPASSTVPPAKKHHPAESPPPRSAAKDLALLSPEPNDAQNMSPGSSTGQTSRATITHHDCITACPCRVEDVDCVAPQQLKDTAHLDSPLKSRQKPAELCEFDQDKSTQSQCTPSRPSPAQRISSPLPRPDGVGSTRNANLTRSGREAEDENPLLETDTANGLASSVPCDSTNLADTDLVGRAVLEAGQLSAGSDSLATRTGLQEGDHNSVNKTPISKTHSSSPTSTDESIQLATPSSSPTTESGTKPSETHAETTKPHKSAPAPKTKRRLTLHSGSYERQTSHKKRKTQQKRKDGVQTTLSLAIGSSAGMRECKLCDTVYNPFHPEDVKVHAKRHAVALKRERKSEEIPGVTEPSLVD